MHACLPSVLRCGLKTPYLLRISQANMCGLERLYSFTRSMTSGVVTLGLLPPIWPGCMSPVDRYLQYNGKAAVLNTFGGRWQQLWTRAY